MTAAKGVPGEVFTEVLWLDKLFDLPPGAVSESLGGLVSFSGAVLVLVGGGAQCVQTVTAVFQFVGRDDAGVVDGADTVSGQ